MSVHLHVRSCYSLLNATLRIAKLIELTKLYGYHAVALCDFQVMHGAMQFYHEAKKADIKPIFGMEVASYLTPEEQLTFIFLAKNDQGYLDLLELSTRYNTSKDSLPFDELHRYAKDCVVLTAGENSSLEAAVVREDRDEIKRYLSLAKAQFPCFYVSIACNDSGLLKIKNQVLKEVATSLSISCCALSRIYYGEKTEEHDYKVLRAIDQGVTLDDKTLNYSPRRYYRSQQEMQELYEPEELACCDAIAQMCNVTMSFPHAQLPKFENNLNIDSATYLRKLCQKGLAKRMHFQMIPKVYQQRLDYELDVIIRMQYADYFLIVWDFIRFARSQKIYVGPGRGSAAGSLVAYCLGITHVDPIQYHLLFERFLNPERISMPDIDTDFPDNRRDEVIAYVQERYGKQHVAHILTFNTLGAKQVLRDVGRVMKIAPRDIDMLCRQVPNVLKATLQYAYEQNPRFKQMVNATAAMRQLFQTAKDLEGLPRHISLHAAGIVFSKQPISSVCPLITLDEHVTATQFTMEYLEELGLIKMDFLGLRNLTIIDEIVCEINQTKEVALDIMRISLNDPATYQLLCDVDTIGIFQLESEGIKQLIRKMQPKQFEDIVATIALFRPGPMENIPLYLERRQNPQSITYMHEDLKDILYPTYGIMIYQEQIMQVAQKMADFSLAKADNLRKAISKKHKRELAQLEQEFLQGAQKQGYSHAIAKDVYDQIMKFANYGFNRSHSVAYALLAYQLAYLKANYPLYFFRSLLNSVIGSETKTSEYIFEARKRKIMIASPSVNASSMQYEMEQHGLRFPLLGIKNVGSVIGNSIVLERKQNGKFLDFYDFVARMITHKVNKKTVESLIHAGAFDEFLNNRAALLASMDDAFRYGELVKIENQDQVTIDFDLVSKPALRIAKEFAIARCEREKEVLGFYLSKHPIANLRGQIDAQLKPLLFIQKEMGAVRFLCYIERIREHRTKKGDLMLFAVGSDDSGKLDLVIFPTAYAKYRDVLRKGTYVLVEGMKKEAQSCIVNHVQQMQMQEGG